MAPILRSMACAWFNLALVLVVALVHAEGLAGDRGAGLVNEPVCTAGTAYVQRGQRVWKGHALVLGLDGEADGEADGDSGEDVGSSFRSSSSARCCAAFGYWPFIDNGVTCGDCTALVLTAPYNGRCDRYCESFGHVCISAAEETAENCKVKYSRPCDTEIAGTSDMLCTCHLPTCQAAAPTPSPGLAPTVPTQPPRGAQRIEVRGRQLLADGRPLHLKGVAWNPVPKGSSRVDFAGFVEQDAELMAQAGINAVRTYSHIGDTAVLDALWARGIWVIDSVYNYGGEDIGDEANGVVASRVREVKDHPAILMWTIGNEWNYNGLYVDMGGSAARARVAAVARIVKRNDGAHPVASIYGEVPGEDVIDGLADIDVWGVNVYRGIGFGDVFETYAQRSSKPLFLGEYGADAFNANTGREDQEAQAKATTALTEDIVARSAVRAGGVCLGGFVFEFADEWWKDSKGSNAVHDQGGVAPGGGPYPDFTFNEEWWGLVDVDRMPRRAFNAYAQVPLALEA
eukprot:CAMPEP_0179209632 /NCGR_PEP_ID=MMETSP0796-20121207/104551_1 /TAXON_ID=73915 /ORGANISM="Pyrodinium bahamense, Strain pbaha01" /LENGTH=513 /DNA_ID=CAMNT_0020914591 /DNA_START=56 /DNA_END=1597 /DNA_ORIENTATION=-